MQKRALLEQENSLSLHALDRLIPMTMLVELVKLAIDLFPEFRMEMFRPRCEASENKWKFPRVSEAVYLSFMHGTAWMMPSFFRANIKNSLSSVGAKWKCAKSEFVNMGGLKRRRASSAAWIRYWSESFLLFIGQCSDAYAVLHTASRRWLKTCFFLFPIRASLSLSPKSLDISRVSCARAFKPENRGDGNKSPGSNTFLDRDDKCKGNCWIAGDLDVISSFLLFSRWLMFMTNAFSEKSQCLHNRKKLSRIT